MMMRRLLDGGDVLAHLVRRGAPGVYFALGWVGLVLSQLLGSLVASAGWWAAKR